ncbi:MocR-like pyridoxine biosynthesis transcription factor PdxR [Sporosarcina beigongshangi]|uniref:MocR-like pyridoxine biosynthesis transcription factor PdxR n=1 Tax=Sporosarcina beigongshangi TaxID=2782538 RepID=UPI0019399B12|nr:PLP-dependent aminotransferase family protein [Sporosarcina beigongshangi]
MELSFNGNGPYYLQIYEQIREKIIQHQLPLQTKLPSKRQLARDLGVSVHTVQEAYAQLVAEGYIDSKERSGYFVAAYDYKRLAQKVQPIQSASSEVIEIEIDFHSGHVAKDAFPFKTWKKLLSRHIGDASFTTSPWQGEWRLRQEIATYVQQSRGVSCAPHQVFISSGTQAQLQMICQFFREAQSVAIEDPGFIRARAVFEQHNIPYKAIPVDEFGVTAPNGPHQLLYTTPAHQFPLGMILTIQRRIELIHWAHQNSAYIIEDDYDGEFRYKGKPIPSLAELDQMKRVIYFGTFSKTLIPSLRMSYFVLPMKLVEPFEQLFALQKSTVSRMDQLTLADFIEQGYWRRHLDKMRTIYRQKQKAIVKAIHQYLTPDFEVIGENSGLHIVLKLPSNLTEKDAIELAEAIHIRVYPVSTSYANAKPAHLVLLGYGGLSHEEIDRGIQLLAKVWCGKKRDFLCNAYTSG